MFENFQQFWEFFSIQQKYSEPWKKILEKKHTFVDF